LHHSTLYPFFQLHYPTATKECRHWGEHRFRASVAEVTDEGRVAGGEREAEEGEAGVAVETSESRREEGCHTDLFTFPG